MQSLEYLGYVIGGRKLRINLMNMEVIIKYLNPTSVTKFSIFDGWYSTFKSLQHLFLLSLHYSLS